MLQTFILQFSGLEAGVTALPGNKACAECNIKNLQVDSGPMLLQLARAFLCWKIRYDREVL